MKAYQKIAKVIPVAVLSTSVLFAPAMSFAAEKQEHPTTVDTASQTSGKTTGIRTLATTNNKVDVENFTKTVSNYFDGYSAVYLIGLINQGGDNFDPMKNPRGKNVIGQPHGKYTSHDTIGYTYLGSSSLTLTGRAVGDGAPKSVTLMSEHNGSDLEQTFNTEEKSEQTTNSFTVSNTEGVAVKLSSTTEAKVDVPFVAGVKTSVTMGLDTTYSHTSSNTVTKTNTVTFKSQPVKVAPHTTTTVSAAVYEQKFDGVDTASKVGIDTKLGFKADVGTGSWQVPLYDLVQAYVKEGNKLPDGITLDTNTKQVIVNDSIETKFSGVLGYKTELDISVTPDGGKAVKMSMADYNNPTTRAKLLAQNK